MSVRYRVLCADEVMARDDLVWPACLRPVERGAADVAALAHWWVFEDDDAPEEFDGKRVALIITNTGDEVLVSDRRRVI
jgi:hypothetical protein